MSKPVAHVRRRQVLSLLAEHGPLSKSGFVACMSPKIECKHLWRVLQTLLKQRLVTKRTFIGSGKIAYFYELTTEPKLLDRASQIVRTDLGSTRSPYFRRTELVHLESCAIWKEILKLLFPSARIIREHEYYGNKEISELLLSSRDERETDPDMLLIFESTLSSDKIAVAIEIERNAKSKRRLVHKLWKYATQTKLDGVVYICDSNYLSERLRQVYNSEILDEALRIKHYGQNFILFTDGVCDVFSNEPLMFNAARENIMLTDWMHELIHTPDGARRDAKFQS